MEAIYKKLFDYLLQICLGFWTNSLQKKKKKFFIVISIFNTGWIEFLCRPTGCTTNILRFGAIFICIFIWRKNKAPKQKKVIIVILSLLFCINFNFNEPDLSIGKNLILYLNTYTFWVSNTSVTILLLEILKPKRSFKDC